MKKAITIVLLLAVFVTSLCGCMQKPPVTITTGNLEEYFTVKTTVKNDFVSDNIFITAIIKVSVDAKEKMDVDSLVVKGTIDIYEKYWSRLHENGKLPVKVNIIVDNTGHGEIEKKLSYIPQSHFSDYYKDDDYYFTCKSASGIVTLM
ncbi:MAG: hypothetical protein UFA98_11770 [Ruminococcus sp.]|nr:hypothetical protein [Ruminococcus sp.]